MAYIRDTTLEKYLKMCKAMFWLFCVSALALGCAGQEGPKEERVCEVCEAEKDQAWSYCGENGPENWGGSCKGKSQSPINIDSTTAAPNEDLTPLTFSYPPLEAAKITNNGHTVQVSPTDGMTRFIEGGLLPDRYNFSQLHFHWGHLFHHGSEHHIDSVAYPMEMHLVHSNSQGEIAVIAVFFTTSWYDNTHMEPIVKALKDIKFKGESTTLESTLDISLLLPDNPNRYYRYMGSLTTPPCTENVTWTVLKKLISISLKQLMEFYNLWSTNSSVSCDGRCHITDNYRPVQDLNERPVYSTPA